MENKPSEQAQKDQTPTFLKSVVAPVDVRTTMKGLPKMCSCFSYGN